MKRLVGKAGLGACLLAALVVMTIPVTAAQAESVIVTRQIDIPAGPMSRSLRAVSRTFGINLIASDELVAGQSAPAVSGVMSAENALRRLLAGTGLIVEAADGGAYVIMERELPAAAEPVGREEPEAESAVRLIDEIVVKGTKIPGTLQDSDVSVEILDEARLDRERITDLSDLFLKTANVTGNGADTGQFSIRGIGRQGFAGRGSTSNVYVDGVPLSGESLIRTPVSLWDVEQAEVLRGSQSSEQGRNALAGAVVISTNDPTFTPEARFRFTYERFDTTQTAAAISGPVISDQLAGRLSVDYRDSDGFVRNVIANDNKDRRESLLVRAKLLFTPRALPDLEARLTVEHNDWSLGESAPIINSGLSVVDPAFADFDFFDYEDFGLMIDSDNTSLRVVGETSYRFSETWLARAILTHEDTDIERVAGIPGDFDAFGFVNFIGFKDEISTAELRAEFDYGTAKGLIGVYYFDANGEDSGDSRRLLAGSLPFAVVNPVDSVISLVGQTSSETRNYALFGQLDWDITDSWTLSLGFRYDEEEYGDALADVEVSVLPANCEATLPGALLNLPAPFVTPPCQQIADQLFAIDPSTSPPDADFSAFLPRVGLTHRFDDRHSVFITYQRGYRAGGSNIFEIPNPDGVGNIRIRDTFDPEYLDTFELGSRNVLLNGRLIANANLFYSVYEDQQIRIVGNNPDSFFNSRVENAAETRLYGAELLLDYRPSTSWNLFASVGLLETEFDDFPFATTGPFENLKGREMPNAPKMTFSLGVSYTGDSGLFASAGLSFIDEQFMDADNLEEEDFRQAFADAGLNPALGARLSEVVESRTDLTARLGYEGEAFTVYAFGSNLLDDEALTSFNYGGVNQATGEVDLIRGTSINGVGATVNRPLSVGIGIDVRF